MSIEEELIHKKYKNNIRKIQVWSNCEDDRLDYRKKYNFHHWMETNIALIEDLETGQLLEVNYKNFRFSTDMNK